MIDLIERMFSDTLWIYTSTAGALIGAAFLAYFRNTRAGIWAYEKFRQGIMKIVNVIGSPWLKEDENAWRKKHPKIASKIEELETRLKELENAMDKSKN